MSEKKDKETVVREYDWDKDKLEKLVGEYSLLKKARKVEDIAG